MAFRLSEIICRKLCCNAIRFYVSVCLDNGDGDGDASVDCMSNCLGEVFYLNSHSAKVFNNFDYWPFASSAAKTDSQKKKKPKAGERAVKLASCAKLFAARRLGNECQCCHKLSNMHNVYIFTLRIVRSIERVEEGGESPDRSLHSEQVNCVASEIVQTYYLFCLYCMCSEANYLLATNFSASPRATPQPHAASEFAVCFSAVGELS